MNNFLNQQTIWNNYFNEKEYKFHINFKKNIGEGAVLHHRNICNTRTWIYKVDTASSKVTTSVNVVVPENVWVLRIVKVVEKDPKILVNYNAQNVYQKVVGRSSIAKAESVSIGKTYNYFYVKPGDEIKLEVQFEDVKTDIDLIASFEVTFFGNNRCEAVVNKVKGNSGLTKEKILDKISSSYVMGKDGEIPEATHESLLFLGCLTAKPQIESMTYENNIDQMRALLSGINAFTKEAILAATDSTKSKGDTDAISFLETLSYMVRNKVSRETLSAMAPMCKRHPLIRENKQVGYVTAYLQSKMVLDKIALYLNEGTEDGLDFVKYFDELTKILLQLKGEMFKNILQYSRQQLQELFNYYQINSKLIVLEHINKLANELPKTHIHRQMAEFYQSLDDLTAAVAVYDREFNILLESISYGGTKTLDTQNVEVQNRQLDKKYFDFNEKFKKLYKLFDGHYAQSFAEAMDDIHEQHLIQSENWLTTEYEGFFKEFTQTYKSSADYNSEEYQKLSDCITSPVRGL
ncbi:MAG: hypothetical protein KDD40_01845 [Bdellovibrionales bacterium]|nr:hypothetical protein [Bdellovibrionales bacterium]